MPELILMCNQKEYVCAAITVNMYRRYVEIMERNVSDSIQDAFEANTRILMDVFGARQREIEQAEPEEVLTAAKEIHFMMQDVITPKFLELDRGHSEQIQKEKSAFDEYDEENGYNEESSTESIWKIYKENVDRVVKICIRLMKNSYQQCMESDIICLLEHAAFEIQTVDEDRR
jgi:hypothetical protein|nr:MAG TPA: hypothetical protein [Caudoviricetes sp.]